MPKKLATTSRLPKLRKHKSSGRAYVELSGKRKYLGVYGTAEAAQRYAAALAEWMAAGCNASAPPEEITIGEATARYLEWANVRYATSTQLHLIVLALRDCNQLYSRIPAKDFGPLKLMALRIVWVDRNLACKTVNTYTQEAKRCFKWLVSREVIPASVWHGLQSVEGLRHGQGTARETEPVQPVAIEEVDKIRPFVSPQVWALVQLQLLTGARPGELLPLCPKDIETTGDVWQARLAKHKGAWRGKERVIFFGEKAKEIIRPYLLRPADKPLFSPREAIQASRRDCPTHRRVNQKPTQRHTPREVHDAYDICSYRRAITRACFEAGIPKWIPYQLRHTAGTEARRLFGLDGAQALLGHSGAVVTQVYAELDQNKAREIAAQIG